MENIRILFSEDNEIAEMESVKCSGDRLDVIVIIDDKIYHPEFYSAESLALECQYFMKSVNNYRRLYNIILVQKPDKQTIINTILELAKKSYFSYFAPYDKKMLENRGFENWESFVQVYPSEK